MDTDIDETEAVYFEVIGQGATSMFTDTTQVLVSTREMWDNYEQYMNPVLPFPEIDFSQLMVVVVAVPVASTGIAIQVQSIEIVEDEMVISYSLGIPGDDCRGNDQPAVPFQVVMLPHKNVLPRFERGVEEFPCTL